MPRFRIYRLKESQQQSFRWSAHTSGAAHVRAKDYEEGGFVEESSVYAAWAALKDTPHPLRVGDLLESEAGELRICKFVGFEEAHWTHADSKADGALPTPAKPQVTGA